MLQGLDSPLAYHEIFNDPPATQGNQGPEGEDPRFGLLESDKSAAIGDCSAEIGSIEVPNQRPGA